MYGAENLIPLDDIHDASRCITPMLFLYFANQGLNGDDLEIPFGVWSGPDNDIWPGVHAVS